jgi:hypothetical protein
MINIIIIIIIHFYPLIGFFIISKKYFLELMGSIFDSFCGFLKIISQESKIDPTKRSVLDPTKPLEIVGFNGVLKFP